MSASGTSFAPYVFELSITQVYNRFLTVFYGEFPYPEVPVPADAKSVRERSSKQEHFSVIRSGSISNGNGIQDPGEEGVGGVCVNLYDANGNLIQKTSTDFNGYYGFDVQSGEDYTIEFVKPDGMEFTQPNVGDDDHDSDADPSIGKTKLIHVTGDDLSWDVGLIVSPNAATPTGTLLHCPKLPSGRFVRVVCFIHTSLISFQTAHSFMPLHRPKYWQRIPMCYCVVHDVEGGGNMLDLERFKEITLDNQRRKSSDFNYDSNLYMDQPPAGGVPASQINVFYANLDQSGWTYDPLYQSWLRSTDTSEPNSAGVLHLDTDRLNGRQLHFENVIIVMADTDVVEPTNLDIHLDPGNTNDAFLFRDGLMYKIKWSTLAGDYEKKTGFERPIRFINADGSPAALKPGHTWVIIVTPFSYLAEGQSGSYLIRYIPPQGEAR